MVIDMLKLRYEWSNYKHLRDRNEAAGINKEIIDKVCLVSVVRLEGWTKYGAVRERCAVFCTILHRHHTKDLAVFFQSLDVFLVSVAFRPPL